MANILKIVFLGVVGFSLLVFLTAEKPKQVPKDDGVIKIVKQETLPATYQIAGKDKIIFKKELFPKNKKKLVVVGNHDSLIVIKDLKKYFKVDIPYVMVANISDAPWLIKKTVITSKLEELSKDTKSPMIIDVDGEMKNALHVYDNTKTKFFAFLISKDGVISKIYEGSVKDNALDGTMNEAEIKSTLAPLAKLLTK